MLEELPGLNARWAERVGGPFGFGIGLNTGEALVGNTGSQSRFKYGPLGHAVNLASRVEGATKHLGVPILITGQTHAALDPGEFLTRRLCQITVVGIDGPLHLHELRPGPATPVWLRFREAYEAGLQQFDKGEVSATCATLAPLFQQTRDNYDRPSLQIVSAAFEAIKHLEQKLKPILKLDGK